MTHPVLLLSRFGSAIFSSMWRVPLQWLLSIVVCLAFVGGTTVQAMPMTDPAFGVAASGPMPGCSDMAIDHETGAPVPHKGLTPDCVKLMQCLGVPDRRANANLIEHSVGYARVAYWTVDRRLNGVSRVPAPFPPKPV